MRFAAFEFVSCLENARRNRAETQRDRSTDSKSLRSITQRHRTTRQSSLRRRPGPSRAEDFQTERAASTQARNVAPLGNRRGTSHVASVTGLLPREKSVDKQKSNSPTARKQILIGSPERRFPPPLGGYPDRADCARSGKARQLRALRNVEQCRAPLPCEDKLRPMSAVLR